MNYGIAIAEFGLELWVCGDYNCQVLQLWFVFWNLKMATKDVGASSVVGTEREGRSVAQSSKKAVREKGASKEMVSSFEARLARIELSLGDIHECLDFLDYRVEHSEIDGAAGVESRLQRTFDTFADTMRFAMDEFREMVMVQIDGVKVELGEVRQDLTLCKTAISSGVGVGSVPTMRVPEPPKFSGKPDVKKIDNFFWMMERYFDAS